MSFVLFMTFFIVLFWPIINSYNAVVKVIVDCDLTVCFWFLVIATNAATTCKELKLVINMMQFLVKLGDLFFLL